MSSGKDHHSSEQESVSAGSESRCEISGSCSGASLTAAVLTHVHLEDSEGREAIPSDGNGGNGESKRESIGEGEEERRGGACEVNEKVAAILKSPQRTIRRRSKHSPSKKRENEDGIQELLENIPEVAQEFDVQSKIGEGTFSSVYVAAVKGVPEQKFAIKHLIPTSASSRIENELQFLQMLGGRDNVMSVCCCLRHRDHVALIMPYFQHNRFADYVGHMTVSEAKLYMRALFLALRNIHSHHIIHRDIKPSNFLYNRAIKQFQLVDFGLAHVESQQNSIKEQKGHSKVNSHKRISSRSHSSTTTTGGGGMVAISNLTTTAATTGSTRLNGILAPPLTYQRQLHHRVATRAAANSASSSSSLSMSARQSVTLAKKKPGASVGGGGVGGGGRLGQTGGGEGGAGRGSGRASSTEADDVIRLCPLRHKVTEVCTACLARSNQVAPRAGTPGFRAPEVLLKYPHQTTAVDIWSAGVILLCILSGRYPFFRAHDDMSALAQIVSLLGSKATADAAKTFGKSLVCVPEVPAMDLKFLLSKLRATSSKTPQSKRDRETQPAPSKRPKRTGNEEITNTTTSLRRSPRKQSQRDNSYNSSSNNLCKDSSGGSASDSDCWNQVPDCAYDLLYKCLDLNPATRITAELALQHSFIVDNR